MKNKKIIGRSDMFIICLLLFVICICVAIGWVWNQQSQSFINKIMYK